MVRWVSTIMRNLIVLDLDLWLAYFKIYLKIYLKILSQNFVWVASVRVVPL